MKVGRRKGAQHCVRCGGPPELCYCLASQLEKPGPQLVCGTLPGLHIYVEPRACVDDFLVPYPRVIVEISENTTSPEIKQAIPTILAWRDGLLRTIGPRTTGLAAIQNQYLEFLLYLHEKKRLHYPQIARYINGRLGVLVEWAVNYPTELWEFHRQRMLVSIGWLKAVRGFRLCWNGHGELSRVPLTGQYSSARRKPGTVRVAESGCTGLGEGFFRSSNLRPQHWNSLEERDSQIVKESMARAQRAPREDVTMEEARPPSMLASLRRAVSQPPPVVSWDSLMKSRLHSLDLPTQRLMRLGFEGEDIEAYLKEAVANVLGGLEPFSGYSDTEYPVDGDLINTKIKGWRVGPVRKLLLERDPSFTVDHDPLERWEDDIMETLRTTVPLAMA